MAKTQKSRAPSQTRARPKPSSRAVPPTVTPVLEWISAAIGLLLLLATIGFVASEAFHPDRSPARMVVESLGVVPTEAGYLVKIRVANRGGSPAAEVVVEGELDSGTGEPQTSEATFDFIADHSTREGGLFFDHDPRAGRLTLRAKGYAAP